MLNGTEVIRPLRDRVLVRELPWRSQTATGLHLPDQAQKGEHVWRAVVVAVGPGKPPIELLKRYAHDQEQDVGAPCDVTLYDDVREGLDQGFGIDGVKPGDVVLVSKYGSTDIRSSKIRYGEDTLDIIAATDILGVLDGEANMLRQALEGALAKLDAGGFGFGDEEPVVGFANRADDEP